MARRILLKVSGESLALPGEGGLDPGILGRLANELTLAATAGLQVAVVVGGGNFLRGQQLAHSGIERSRADFMGMLATIMNGIALQSAIESQGGRAEVLSAIALGPRVPEFEVRRCVASLERGEISVLVGGTGHPYFTTDTCAALRAVEIGADLLVKGTKVDGVYTGDPKRDPEARLFKALSFQDVLEKRLGVMDSTAIALCQEHGLPILVFNLLEDGNLRKVLRGEDLGTLVGGESRPRAEE
ncbi:MAG: UMP kinase [Planctomycetota bacterium]